jgi:hypothetical protein
VHEFTEREQGVERSEPSRPARRPSIQRRLVVGRSRDPIERDADRTADRLVDPTGGDGGPPSLVFAERGSSRIRRMNADTEFVTRLNEMSDLTALRVRLVEWDGALTERVARHFGIARFKELVSSLGEQDVLGVGAAQLLQADPTDPFSIAGLQLERRVRLARSWKLGADRIAIGLVRMLGRESTAANNVLATAAGLGVSFRQLVDAWLVAPPVPLVGFKPLLLAVAQTDRDLLSQDAAWMATAKRVLPTDDYLGMLPILRVLTPPTVGTTAAKWGTWTPANLGPEVDTIIRTQLNAYIGGAMAAGRMVEGQVSIVGPQDWADAFHRQWKRVSLQGCINTAMAFVDVNQPGRHIWIHNDRGSPGTAVHEGIHKYADPTLRDELINTYRGGGDDVCNLDEGITEYFTRLAIARGGLGYPRRSYANQLAAANLLIPRIGLNVVAAAYFDGQFQALKTAFGNVTGNRWDDYARALETNDYTLANSLV